MSGCGALCRDTGQCNRSLDDWISPRQCAMARPRQISDRQCHFCDWRRTFRRNFCPAIPWAGQSPDNFARHCQRLARAAGSVQFSRCWHASAGSRSWLAAEVCGAIAMVHRRALGFGIARDMMHRCMRRHCDVLLCVLLSMWAGVQMRKETRWSRIYTCSRNFTLADLAAGHCHN